MSVDYNLIIKDSNGNSVSIDSVTQTLRIIEHEHHEIHEGDFYRAGFQKDVSNGNTAEFIITTPNTTKWIHFRPAVDVELESIIQIYENVTSIVGGTSVVPKNANRNSSNTSGAVCIHTPTSYSTASATLLSNIVEGSGKSSGGNSSSVYEWILKQNTSYLVLVTNNATSNNQVNIRNSWYEHTNA